MKALRDDPDVGMTSLPRDLARRYPKCRRRPMLAIPSPGLYPVAVDADVDAALVLVEAGPASVAIALAVAHPPRAGQASDRRIAVHHQGMFRQSPLFRVARQVFQRPIDQRIEAEASVGKLDPFHGGAR